MENLTGIIAKNSRQIFTDSANDETISDKGMFILPLLTDEQVKESLSVYQLVESGINDKFYNTLASNNLDYRKQVNDKLEQIVGTTIRSVFNKYKVLAYNFAAKSSGKGSMCHIHNDDSHADENLYTCINVWIPLVDVSESNGSLYVLPHSHKLPYNIRGIGLPFAYEKYIHLIPQHRRIYKTYIHPSQGFVAFCDSTDHTKYILQ